MDEMTEGFELVGKAGGGHLLPADDLEDQAPRSNSAILHSTKSSGHPLVDVELWRKTLEETGKGWPKIPDNGGWTSRRFAAVQSERVSPIDNYNESQINNAVTIVTCSTVDLHNGSSKRALKIIKNKSLHPRVPRVTQWQVEQPPATHTHRLLSRT